MQTAATGLAMSNGTGSPCGGGPVYTSMFGFVVVVVVVVIPAVKLAFISFSVSLTVIIVKFDNICVPFSISAVSYTIGNLLPILIVLLRKGGF